jgi:thiol:disulfide interchange protein
MSRFRFASTLPLLVVLAAFAAALALPAPASAGSPPAQPEANSTPALHWHPVGEEQVLADREGKAILYFFTADWCAPCHQLKRTLFSDPEKVSQIAASFVPVQVQDRRVETGSNDPEVDAAIRRYGVNGLPTLVVALPDGQELSQQRGYAGVDRAWQWIQEQAEAAGRQLDGR